MKTGLVKCSKGVPVCFRARDSSATAAAAADGGTCSIWLPILLPSVKIAGP